MFRNFSFEGASRCSASTQLEAERAAMNISPTSIPFAPPPLPARLPTPPPCSVGELTQRLRHHNLEIEVHSGYTSTSFCEPLTPPSDDVSYPTETASQPSHQYVSPAALRLQRQRNTRLQCNPGHVKDISILVERMIEEGDQCCIYDTESRSSSISSSDEDEGIDMEYTPLAEEKESPLFTLKFRRSGERLNGQACVSKSVRMRKRHIKSRKSISSQ